MVQNQGIDAYLAPFADITKPYQQHGVPTASPAFIGDFNEVYIEAVDGERFAVVVDLMEDFDMHGAEYLCIVIHLDQDRGKDAHSCHATLSKLEAGVPRATALKSRSIHSTINRKMDGSWMTCGFTFKPLVIGKYPYFSIGVLYFLLTTARTKVWTWMPMKF